MLLYIPPDLRWVSGWVQELEEPLDDRVEVGKESITFDTLTEVDKRSSGVRVNPIIGCTLGEVLRLYKGVNTVVPGHPVRV